MSPSSAEAERGFSQLKLVKTNIRSMLGQISLNNCLGIKLLGSDIQSFDPFPAIDYWNNSSVRSRRPVLKETGKNKSGVQLALVNDRVLGESHNEIVTETETEAERKEDDVVDDGSGKEKDTEREREEQTEVDSQTGESEAVCNVVSVGQSMFEVRKMYGFEDECEDESDYESGIDSDLEEDVVFSRLFEFSRD